MSDESLPEIQGEGTPAVIPGSMTVFAQNPLQMRQAQAQMVEWAQRKVEETKALLADLEQNLEIAKKNKWRTSTLKTAVLREQRRSEFYCKTKQALEAGYCMVPNFPTGVFAIRTTRETPKATDLQRQSRYLPTEKSNCPPEGEGEYVDPQVPAVSCQAPDKEGKLQTWWSAGEDYSDVSFPFTLVKPEIMEATQRAMALKVFDEIGCLPESVSSRRYRDPIIVGKITHRQSTYSETTFTFLIAWFMDLDRM